MASYGPEAFQKDLNVSRETMARLERYAALLEKWSKAINLVSPASLPELWRRHMLDSAQLLALLPPPPDGRPRILLDLGSGAGFPGLVLAILGAGEVHLAEADGKKAAFLREAAQITETPVEIHNLRIEDIGPLHFDVLTARALAPLPRLLDLIAPLFPGEANEQTNIQDSSPGNVRQGREPVALLLKGRNADRELTDAGEKWMMRAQAIPSRSDPQGRILRITGLARNRQNS